MGRKGKDASKGKWDALTERECAAEGNNKMSSLFIGPEQRGERKYQVRALGCTLGISCQEDLRSQKADTYIQDTFYANTTG